MHDPFQQRQPLLNNQRKWGNLVKRLLIVLEILSYLFLLGLSLVFVLPAIGACFHISSGGISCRSPIFEDLAEFSLGLLLMSVFTGVPLILAFVGLIFLSMRVFRGLGFVLNRISSARLSSIPGTPNHVFWRAVYQVSNLARSTIKWIGYLLGGILTLGAVAKLMEGSGP